MDRQTEVILAARCGAGARNGVNEDNCLVVSSVGNPKAKFNHLGDGQYLSEVISLGRNGCLLVVADGMGGMNAGEVASQTAVETIARYFSDPKINKMELTDGNVRKWMRKSIIEADSAIKKAASKDKEKEGMGTTVAMLWILNEKAYYAWCGDSRIYRYNEGTLDQLSNDHSYVYEVLHLSEEEAFTHPNNNIITRCLGNPGEQAVPEIPQPERIAQGDLFLLCSDGFCGIIRNSEIVDLLQMVTDKPEHLNEGLDLMWKSAEEHHWHDNMTTLLCYVKSGPAKPALPEKPKIAAQTIDPATAPSSPRRKVVVALVSLLVVGLLLAAGWFLLPKFIPSLWNKEPETAAADTVVTAPVVEPDSVILEEDPAVGTETASSEPTSARHENAQHENSQPETSQPDTLQHVFPPIVSESTDSSSAK